ncbi:MAG: thioredoxin fold domain-containing protein [Cyclobacteriaceae bacterium]
MPEIKKPSGKILVIIFSSIILISASFLIFKIADKKRVIEGRNVFTSLEITLPGNSTYIITSSNQEDSFILMFFNPDCYYCHVETEAILNHMDYFANVNIFMVTTSEPGTIINFENTYSLHDFPRIITGRISEDAFWESYGIRTVPSLMIYNDKGSLLYSNSGYTPVSEIIDVLSD